MKHLDLQEYFIDAMRAIVTPTSTPFLTIQIEGFLNQAQDEYIDSLVKVYERNETARKALVYLTTDAQLPFLVGSTTIPLTDESKFYTIPADCSRVVEEQVVDGTTKINVKPITHDQYNANRENPFKKPYGKLVWRLDIDGQHELVPDSTTTLDEYNIRYIKKHDPISFAVNGTCQLRDVDMYRIVDIAVNLALKSIGGNTANQNS